MSEGPLLATKHVIMADASCKGYFALDHKEDEESVLIALITLRYIYSARKRGGGRVVGE